MNKLQAVFCAISGYEYNAPFSSARDEYYYECTTEDEQISQIKNYAEAACEIYLTDKQSRKINSALLKAQRFNSTNEWGALYLNLK